MAPRNSNKKLRNILVFTDPGLISLSLSLSISIYLSLSQSHTNISFFNFLGNKMSKKKKNSKINIKRTCLAIKGKALFPFLNTNPVYIYIYIYSIFYLQHLIGVTFGLYLIPNRLTRFRYLTSHLHFHKVKKKNPPVPALSFFFSWVLTLHFHEL